MNIRRSFLGIVSVLVACMVEAGSASAGQVLYDSSGFLRGTQSFSQSLDIVSAGTLTVTLSNIAWPEQLSSLDLVLSSANGKMGPEMGAGIASFTIASGGEVFAQWFGTAQGALDAGVFSIKIEFSPLGSGGTPVALPAAFVLLLSGLALLGWQGRRNHTGLSEGAVLAAAP